MPSFKIDVVIPAAGVGSRVGATIPKQYIKLDDKCILEHTILKVMCSKYINNIIIVIGEKDDFFSKLEIAKSNRIKVCIGGAERVNSVLSGIYKTTTDYVMVHDAARPLIRVDDIDKLCKECINSKCDGGLLVSKVSDTLKQAKDSVVIKTIDRDDKYRALTPQLFKRDLLISAIEDGLKNNINITDEASAMEFKGHKVKIVEGHGDNFKITTKDDLFIAKAILAYKE